MISYSTLATLNNEEAGIGIENNVKISISGS